MKNGFRSPVLQEGKKEGQVASLPLCKRNLALWVTAARLELLSLIKGFVFRWDYYYYRHRCCYSEPSLHIRMSLSWRTPGRGGQIGFPTRGANPPPGASGPLVSTHPGAPTTVPHLPTPAFLLRFFPASELRCGSGSRNPKRPIPNCRVKLFSPPLSFLRFALLLGRSRSARKAAPFPARGPRLLLDLIPAGPALLPSLPARSPAQPPACRLVSCRLAERTAQLSPGFFFPPPAKRGRSGRSMLMRGACPWRRRQRRLGFPLRRLVVGVERPRKL